MVSTVYVDDGETEIELLPCPWNRRRFIAPEDVNEVEHLGNRVDFLEGEVDRMRELIKAAHLEGTD